VGLGKDDKNWDHYVYSADPISGMELSERCTGYRTALWIAEQRRLAGCWRVRIVSKRAERHKEVQSRVAHGLLRGQYSYRPN
jgi:hypothetical protein